MLKEILDNEYKRIENEAEERKQEIDNNVAVQKGVADYIAGIVEKEYDDLKRVFETEDLHELYSKTFEAVALLNSYIGIAKKAEFDSDDFFLNTLGWTDGVKNMYPSTASRFKITEKGDEILKGYIKISNDEHIDEKAYKFNNKVSDLLN